MTRRRGDILRRTPPPLDLGGHRRPQGRCGYQGSHRLHHSPDGETGSGRGRKSSRPPGDRGERPFRIRRVTLARRPSPATRVARDTHRGHSLRRRGRILGLGRLPRAASAPTSPTPSVSGRRLSNRRRSSGGGSRRLSRGRGRCNARISSGYSSSSSRHAGGGVDHRRGRGHRGSSSRPSIPIAGVNDTLRRLRRRSGGGLRRYGSGSGGRGRNLAIGQRKRMQFINCTSGC